jgi:tetratricopeptide (TPR) repeat protein
MQQIMDSEKLYWKAEELCSKGKHSSAVSIYKEITKHSDDPRYFIAFGVCLKNLGHWKQSIAQLEKGISLKPHYCEGDARLFLADAYLKAGKKSHAIAQWRHVSKMEPEYPSYESVQNEAKKMLEQHA